MIPVSGDTLINYGILIFSIGVGISIMRHEMMLSDSHILAGNEPLRKLLEDGIWLTEDEYFRRVSSGDLGVARRFWSAGIVNKKNSSGESDLQMACISENYLLIKGILERGADLNGTDRQGRTPLHYAIERGNPVSAKKLIEIGAKVNVQTLEGITPLHCAAAKRDADSMQALLDAGARIDSTDSDNMTPMITAACQSRWESVRILLDAGANAKHKDCHGATVLDYAYHRNADGSLIDLLLVAGVESNPLLVNRGHCSSSSGKATANWELKHGPAAP